MAGQPRFCLVGAPWDLSSSDERGSAEGPPRIREALWSPSTNTATELGLAVEPEALDDLGDLDLGTDAFAARTAIEEAVRRILARRGLPVVLGGDHSITYPVLRAFRDRPVAAIVHIDAHSDLYDQFPASAPEGASARLRPGHVGSQDTAAALGDRFSHACPFARIMEDGLTDRLIQVGIRTATEHLRAQAERFGVEVFGPRHLERVPLEELTGPVYVSLDLDGLDPAYAPGVAHPEPGGLSTRDVVGLLHRIRAPIVGADIVEYNPRFDTRDLTARVAAKLLKELVAVAARNGPAT